MTADLPRVEYVPGQLALPPPDAPLRPLPVLAAAVWRTAVRQCRDLPDAVKDTAVRMTDTAADTARTVPSPGITALAAAAGVDRGVVVGHLAALTTAGWLAPTRGPDEAGRPLLRLGDGGCPR